MENVSENDFIMFYKKIGNLLQYFLHYNTKNFLFHQEKHIFRKLKENFNENENKNNFIKIFAKKYVFKNIYPFLFEKLT